MPLSSQPNFSPIGHSLLTREFSNAQGTYETVRVHHGKPFHLSGHLDRIENAARVLGMVIPVPRTVIETQVIRTIEASNLAEAIVYMLITTTIDGLELKKSSSTVPLVSITCDPFHPKPAEWYTAGMNVVIKKFQRINPEIKDLSQRSAKKELSERIDADDVLIENDAGEITESRQCNLFIVKDNELFTPASGMLPGVTRKVVMKIAQKLLPVKETTLRRDDVLNADECFLTGTLHNVVPVTTVEGRLVGDGLTGQWTKKIMEKFEYWLHL